VSERRGEYDLVVVGAGFAGLYTLHKMRGLGLSTRVFEAGGGVGGTWYWNRYPGARCDVESMEYSYQFSEELQQEWEWTERYSAQPEILRYANHVADRFDLRSDIQLDTRVTAAHFDDEAGRWNIDTDAGDRVSAQFLVMATGCLSSTNEPDFEGLADFEGPTYHTGRWPHEGVDFSGQRVGVIGTGSSAIQSIPIIAEQAGQLFVFQRTPNYSVPAHNAPIDPEWVREVKADYKGFRKRNSQLPFGLDGGLGFLGCFEDLGSNQQANDSARQFLHVKIREIVKDPAVAELLGPDHAVGCKRPCVDTGYFASFNRSNVRLVDVSREPIERITSTGLVAAGEAFELDSIVFATGFDAMTGSLLRVDIRGRQGLPLAEKWAAGPRTYLGLQTAGFPNLFTITGPGSPSVLSNMIPSIEQHVDWIGDCLAYLGEHGKGRIEATLDAEDAWVEHVNEVAGESLYLTCNSWYLGANVPGKPRVFMPYLGFPPYVEKCDEVAAKGYEGFALE
jgi:cyclohexanone monooxygenase